MSDFTTKYLGLTLRSPLVASAGPLTGSPDMWGMLEDAGAGAVVLPSLFEEQIEQDAASADFTQEYGTNSFSEALTYLPDIAPDDTGPDRHVALVELARKRLSIPVIASLNGITLGGWVRYARILEEAGADAIELNLYDVIVDPLLSAADVERRYLDLVEEVKMQIKIPLAVKIGPWFTALAHFAVALERAGSDGIVLFNRLYQPDINLDTLTVEPRLQLSTSSESRLPLHWIGVLRGLTHCSLAATTGVHDGADALKLLLAGADVVMTTSALLRYGPGHIAVIEAQIRAWMHERDYTSIEELTGSVSRMNVPDPHVYERANYYQTLHSWTPGAIGQESR